MKTTENRRDKGYKAIGKLRKDNGSPSTALEVTNIYFSRRSFRN
jgi:hypothetical protein